MEIVGKSLTLENSGTRNHIATLLRLYAFLRRIPGLVYFYVSEIIRVQYS